MSSDMADARSQGLRRWVDYLAAVGVIVSITFVGLELRQNTAAIRGATYQDLAANSTPFTIALSSDGELASLYLRWRDDPDSMGEVERYRVHVLLLGIGRQVESAFQQHRVGTLTDDLWLGFVDSWRVQASSPGFADYWARYKTRFSTEFQAYVDSTLLR